MPHSSNGAKVTASTWVGLFIALIGILIIRWAVGCFYPTFSFTATLWKESLIWLSLIALLILMRCGEGLPFRSINIGTAPVKSSILWGGILALLCGVVGAAIASLAHFKGGKVEESLARLPLWLVILIVLRAGVIEEVFYRGYAIERLQLLGLNRFWAGVIPLLIFGFAHETNGWANVMIALALGLVLTVVYLWRRDLIANMIGHFLVDFISVVLPRLLSHS